VSASTTRLEREASFQLLFHGQSAAMWVVDADTLAFLVVNDVAVQNTATRARVSRMKMDQMAEPRRRRWRTRPRPRGDARGERGVAAHDEGRLGAACGKYVARDFFRRRDAVLVLSIDRTAQRRRRSAIASRRSC